MRSNVSSVRASRIPLTIFCGPRDAGTTRLLSGLATSDSGHRLGVVFEDVGAVQFDPEAVDRRDGDVVILRGGATCCGSRGDRDAALLELSRSDWPPDHVLVEASMSPQRSSGFGYMPGYEPDGLVAVVNPLSIRRLADDPDEGTVLRDQLRRANVVVITDTHTTSRADVLASQEHIRLISPRARMLWSGAGGIAAPLLIGLRSVRPTIDSPLEVEWTPDYVLPSANSRRGTRQSLDGSSYTSWRLYGGAVSGFHLRRWVSALPPWIIRGNGTVTLHELPGARHDFHYFGHQWRLDPRAPREGEPAVTRVVLVGLRPEDPRPDGTTTLQ